MSETFIEKLTSEQESLIPVYQEKWRGIALSTERIDRQKAKEAVRAAYTPIGLKEPEIIFFDSPYAALNTVIRSPLRSQLGSQLPSQMELTLESQLGSQLESEVWSQLERELSSQLGSPLERELWSQLESQLESELDSELDSELWSQLFYYCISSEFSACDGSWFDFCISVLNCAHDQKLWLAYQSVVKYCGWIFPFENICLVCERPIKLSFDSEQRLHAEGEPAIQFADGYSLYSYHGVTLPEKYGVLHPHHWQAQWLIEESNAELRRALIQGIGYARICQELQAIELDSWHDYTLLQIDTDVYNDPISLLKMICPSTGFIHALRVPPNVQSAREAIQWVNWGTDPEEFSVQT